MLPRGQHLPTQCSAHPMRAPSHQRSCSSTSPCSPYSSQRAQWPTRCARPGAAVRLACQACKRNTPSCCCTTWRPWSCLQRRQRIWLMRASRQTSQLASPWHGLLRCASQTAECGGLQQATFFAASFPGRSRRAGLTHSIMQPVPSSMLCRPERGRPGSLCAIPAARCRAGVPGRP